MSHNDKAKKGFCSLLLKYHIYISIQTVYFGNDYSLESSWVCRYKPGTPVWGVSPHTLQILSSAVRLDGVCRCTAIFRSFQRCLTGFKSGLWLGHSRTFKDLSRSQSCVVLAVFLGSLSCWKLNLRPQSKFLSALEQVFIQEFSVLCFSRLSLNSD